MKRILAIIAMALLPMRFTEKLRCKYPDFHDYPDSIVGEPWHFYEHTCKRCGHKFHI